MDEHLRKPLPLNTILAGIQFALKHFWQNIFCHNFYKVNLVWKAPLRFLLTNTVTYYLNVYFMYFVCVKECTSYQENKEIPNIKSCDSFSRLLRCSSFFTFRCSRTQWVSSKFTEARLESKVCKCIVSKHI